MRFSSHFSVSAREYSSSDPDLTHYTVPEAISRENGLVPGEGELPRSRLAV